MGLRQGHSYFIYHSLFVLLLILGGCAPAETTPESVLPTPMPTFVTPTSTPTPTPEPTPMIVTLKLWLPPDLYPYGEGPGADTMARQLSDFNDAYPDLQVQVTQKKAHGRGGLLDFMRTAEEAAPSILPDLVVLDMSDLETAAGAGLIQPLDDLLPQSTIDAAFPFATMIGQVDGQMMGMVLGADMQHLAYRQALFDSPPISWTQVISAPAPFLFPGGGYDKRVNDATLIQYLAAGGKLTDADGAPMLDEEVLIDVFDFYSRCITNTVIAPTTVLTSTHVDQVWERFKAGEGGMTVVRAGRYWREADETMAPAPIPTRHGRPLSIARGWALAMVVDDPARQDLAMLLFNWLTDSGHSARWTQEAGYLPATSSTLRLWNVSKEEQAMLRGLLESAIPAPRAEVMNAVGPPMQDALQAVLQGWEAPDEAAAEAVEEVQR